MPRSGTGFHMTFGKLLNISDNLSSKLIIAVFTILTSQEFCRAQLIFINLLTQITSPVEMQSIITPIKAASQITIYSYIQSAVHVQALLLCCQQKLDPLHNKQNYEHDEPSCSQVIKIDSIFLNVEIFLSFSFQLIQGKAMPFISFYY